MKEVIVQVIGGLGNQLFQYAAGRKLAIDLNARLRLDISGFTTYYDLRKYSMHHLNIVEDFIQLDELQARSKDILFVKEPSLGYCPNIFDDLKGFDSVYLEGYWGSERYFESIDHVIRGEFSVKTPPSQANIEMGRRILATESICLHVRRGDYAWNPVARQVHGLCSLDYYRESLGLLGRVLSNPVVYVFSDDQEWASKNLNIPFEHVFVRINDESKNYEDIRLMSLCKHFIIANSTFSWWGAWLSTFPNKIILAPQQWLKDPKLSWFDPVPLSWRNSYKNYCRFLAGFPRI
jgi:hypothetical protein